MCHPPADWASNRSGNNCILQEAQGSSCSFLRMLLLLSPCAPRHSSGACSRGSPEPGMFLSLHAVSPGEEEKSSAWFLRFQFPSDLEGAAFTLLHLELKHCLLCWHSASSYTHLLFVLCLLQMWADVFFFKVGFKQSGYFDIAEMHTSIANLCILAPLAAVQSLKMPRLPAKSHLAGQWVLHNCMEKDGQILHPYFLNKSSQKSCR